MRDLSHLDLSAPARKILSEGYPNAHLMDDQGWREAIRKYSDRAALLKIKGCTPKIAAEVMSWAWQGQLSEPMTSKSDRHLSEAFSTRVYNVLKNEGIIRDHMLAEELALAIASRSDSDLLRCANFGRKSLIELRSWAASTLNGSNVLDEMRKTALNDHAAALAKIQERLNRRLAEIDELQIGGS